MLTLMLLAASIATERYVTPPEKHVTEILWESEAGRAACGEAMERAANGKNMAEIGRLMDEANEKACTPATVATLSRGTLVNLLPEPKQCGILARVTVASGKDEGRTGCIVATSLSESASASK